MRAVALLAGLAGLALLLATATSGRHGQVGAVGWTGYAPLPRGARMVCDPSAATPTVVLPTTKPAQTVRMVFRWTGDVHVVSEGSSQIVCRVATAPTP